MHLDTLGKKKVVIGWFICSVAGDAVLSRRHYGTDA
jgi:hypothetical protein